MVLESFKNILMTSRFDMDNRNMSFQYLLFFSFYCVPGVILACLTLGWLTSPLGCSVHLLDVPRFNQVNEEHGGPPWIKPSSRTRSICCTAVSSPLLGGHPYPETITVGPKQPIYMSKDANNNYQTFTFFPFFMDITLFVAARFTSQILFSTGFRAIS